MEAGVGNHHFSLLLVFRHYRFRSTVAITIILLLLWGISSGLGFRALSLEFRVRRFIFSLFMVLGALRVEI